MPIIIAMSEAKTNDIRVLDEDILLVLHFIQEVGMTLNSLQNSDMWIYRENWTGRLFHLDGRKGPKNWRMRLRHVCLFRWTSVDFRQPGPQNLTAKALPSVTNPHSTTISAAAPSTCKPLHRSTPGWGAFHSDCRCCGDQHEEHGAKQTSSGEPAWSTSSRAAALGLALGILAMDVFFQTIAKERSLILWPSWTIKGSGRPEYLAFFSLVLTQGNGFNHKVIST